MKEVAYLNMREASAAAALDKLWSDTFLTNAGIDAGNSSGYTYRGSANFDVVANPTFTTKLLVPLDSNVNDIQSSISGSIGGTSSISTSVKKFGAGSLYCNDSPSLVFPYSSNYDFGSGDFTIEAWIRFTASPSSSPMQIFLTTNGGNTSNRFFWNEAQSAFRVILTSGGSTILDFIGSDTLTTDTWYHVAFVRYGNVFSIYRDGVLKASSTASITLGTTSEDFRSGMVTPGLPVYMDDLRVVKGAAKYTAAFTPPTAALPVDSGSNMVLQSVQALNLASNISSVMTFLDLSAGTLVSLQVSTDNGSTWTSVQRDQVSPVPAGSQVKIKVTTDGAGIIESWGIAA